MHTPSPFRDGTRGRENLAALLRHVGPEVHAILLPLLTEYLPTTADPDMAANNLERLLAQPRARSYLPQLLDVPSRNLETILHLLATSQFFADTLAIDPDALEPLLQPPGRNPSTSELTTQLRLAVEAATDDANVLRAFRRFRRRQALRIGINDVIRDRPLEEISRDLARVADASIEIAMQHALRTTAKKFGSPTTTQGSPARLAALAFGKLGGDELNYSSDLDLMFVYDDEGETVGKRSPIANSDFFARVVSEILRLLSSHTDTGFAYRIDLRLRPEGQRGPLARTLANTLSYYDVMGRTWERQALIKVRPCAGDPELGREFVTSIEPFVYRKYFSFSEINEVKALKRQMEQRSIRGGVDDRDVKVGRGGIRDIEYTVQFLQLLNGGDLRAVRQRNTLLSLEALEIAGCLTGNETYILSDAYRFLRKTEHRLQLLFDMQTHRLPDTSEELRKLALRMGYAEPARVEGRAEAHLESMLRPPPTSLSPQRRSPLDEPTGHAIGMRGLLVDPLDQFLKDLQDKTRLDRGILDHLLHQTFPDADSSSEPESDLILDPDPDDATVKAVLGRYPFADVAKAYQNLSQLARESVRFLSHRRCRHFLASIAPQLLRAVAETPDPDETLNTLEKVTASLGAKAVLYELFSFNPATLKLYVDLCAGSPFLCGLMMNNPGMIDELLDSLVLDQPRSADELRIELAELLRGATDPDPILHSFQDKELLRIGVRDLLGKAPIRETTAGLSDIAETVLNAVIDLQEPHVRARYGIPSITRESGEVVPCPYVVLGMGKLGGREINYHSDLDLLLIFQNDGATVAPDLDTRIEVTTNYHAFTDLAQKVIQATTRNGPMGRLYAVDMRLRPTGKSGSLVVPLTEFARYFREENSQPWERQSLTRARVLRGDATFANEVLTAIRTAIVSQPWQPDVVMEILAMRTKLEANGRGSLKRAAGGLVDVEFLVQAMQLKHGEAYPQIMQANVWDALESLRVTGLLPPEDADVLRDGYSFLRLVEARLRMVADRPLTVVPDAEDDREKLARRLGFEAGEGLTAGARFTTELTRVMSSIRQRFHIDR